MAYQLRYKDWPIERKRRVNAASMKYAKAHPEKTKEINQRSYYKNREDRLARSKKYRNANPEYVLRHILRKYGLTPMAFRKMNDLQNGVCKICGETEPGSQTDRLSVDHCHIRNKVRGLLCSNCNTGLGKFKHSIDLLYKAGEYLYGS